MNSQAEKLIDTAKSYVGYLEKATNAQLEDFTANAGSGNFTLFGAWYPMQAQPWCASFVSYCADKAGISTDIIPKHASCSIGVAWFKKAGRWHARAGYTPQAGDIVYFTNNGTSPAHIGIVWKVDANTVYTIEGNTGTTKDKDGKDLLITNGGGVAKKSYPLTSSYILGYGNPAYEDEVSEHKATIQAHVKFSDPDDVWRLMDKHVYAKDLYRKWAESYK